MLPITVLAVGSLKERWMKAACAEYEKRLLGRCKLDVVELPEIRVPERPRPGDVAQALEKEAAALRQRIPPRAYPVALCIEGQAMPSEDLAALLEEKALSHPGAAFLIGSSHGLDEALKREARLRLSFSPMTFPHQLARVMLLEQLYRCAVLLTGGKYHK